MRSSRCSHTVFSLALDVYAGFDLVPPANAVRLARWLPNSSLHLVPDGGHLVPFGAVSAGARLLAEFFASGSLDSSIAWTTGLLEAERPAAA